MRVYIPSMDEFFAWAHANKRKYVVLRGFHEFETAYPRPLAKADVDLLVEDGLGQELQRRYRWYTKAQGTKCDVYDVSGTHGADYLGFPYLPVTLARQVLNNRKFWRDRFYIPDAADHLHSLLYHVAYHKAEHSGLHLHDASLSTSKYRKEIDELLWSLSLQLSQDLTSIHRYLVQQGFSPAYEVQAAYLRNDFSRHFKSKFRAQICAESPGEMNLFVVRGVAVRKGLHSEIIKRLQDRYKIVAVKDISLMTKLATRHRMRGGKWKRGGMPAIAVVVFDPDPVPVPAEDANVHPFVFNARQFMKRELRTWFANASGTDPKHNPLHSTDNEAEALGHLPLFFSHYEQVEIMRQLEDLRRQVAAHRSKRA
jgi:hypothetical protein